MQIRALKGYKYGLIVLASLSLVLMVLSTAWKEAPEWIQRSRLLFNAAVFFFMAWSWVFDYRIMRLKGDKSPAELRLNKIVTIIMLILTTGWVVWGILVI